MQKLKQRTGSIKNKVWICDSIKKYSFTDTHTHTHDFTDAENNDYTHRRTCGIPGIARNDLTAWTARRWRWAALDKAGSCRGSIRSCVCLVCVCVCVCVWRWCNECWRWVGAALKLSNMLLTHKHRVTLWYRVALGHTPSHGTADVHTQLLTHTDYTITSSEDQHTHSHWKEGIGQSEKQNQKQ